MSVQSSSENPHCEVTAAVLAGGLGRRMGGKEKGLLPLAGAPLVDWVVRAVRPQVQSLLLNGGEHYAGFGYPLLADAVPGRPGPLAGMLAGLEQAQTEFVLTVPCDMPRLPGDLVSRLCTALRRGDADLAVASDGSRTHPVVSLAHRSLAPSLRRYLAAGHRKVQQWVQAQRVVEVDFSDEADAFINVNTPEELRAVEQTLERPVSRIPVLGFAAFSGTGKTTMLEQLIPALAQRGVRVSLVKHAHHEFDIDKPGKDSYRLRKAGAKQVLIASRHRWALMTELDESLPEPPLAELLAQLDPDRVDLVLLEGFKHEPVPKIELHRPGLGKPLLHPDDPEIIALATDAPPERPGALPLLDLNDIDAIADFVAAFARRSAPLERTPFDKR